MNTLLDANACLRYLLNDNASQADIVADTIRTGAEITLEVLAECVYVLEGVYKVERSAVSQTLEALLGEVNCVRSTVAVMSLQLYKTHNLDFVDCILLAESRINDRTVLTFDKKLNRALLSFSKEF